MERKGVYRKGSQGHVRNISSYKYYREKIKSWRAPITGALVVLMIFGISPLVGEQLYTSVLSVESDVAARKELVLDVKWFVSECKRLAEENCVVRGEVLLGELGSQAKDVRVMNEVAAQFKSDFAVSLAKKACKFDIGNQELRIRSVQDAVAQFAEKYSLYVHSNPQNLDSELNAVLASLERFVESCRLE